jgi:hypothetical protein
VFDGAVSVVGHAVACGTPPPVDVQTFKTAEAEFRVSNMKLCSVLSRWQEDRCHLTYNLPPGVQHATMP